MRSKKGLSVLFVSYVRVISRIDCLHSFSLARQLVPGSDPCVLGNGKRESTVCDTSGSVSYYTNTNKWVDEMSLVFTHYYSNKDFFNNTI